MDKMMGDMLSSRTLEQLLHTEDNVAGHREEADAMMPAVIGMSKEFIESAVAACD